MADDDATVHPTNEEVRKFVGAKEVDGHLVPEAHAEHFANQRARLGAPRDDDPTVHPTTDEVRAAAGFVEVAGFLVPQAQAEEQAQLLQSQETMPASNPTLAARAPTSNPGEVQRVAEAAPNPATYRTRRARADSE